MQSSAAPIALAIVGLQGGAIAWDVAAHLAVGASVGTTSTGLLATLGTRASARRIAAAWATCASVQAAIAMLAFAPLAWFAHAVGAAAGSMLGAPEGPVAIAAFHTAFTGLGLVPLVAAPRAWARAIAFFVPDRSGIPPVVQYDRSALEVPGVAAATARRGLLQAAAAVTDLGLAALRGRNGALEDRIDNASLSLEATREFLGEIAVPEGDRGTVDLQRGSVGALDHLARLVGDVRNLRRIGHAPATAPEVDEYLAEAAAALEAFRSWLADPSSPLPRATSPATGRRAHRARPERRSRTSPSELFGGDSGELTSSELTSSGLTSSELTSSGLISSGRWCSPCRTACHPGVPSARSGSTRRRGNGGSGCRPSSRSAGGGPSSRTGR